MQCKGGNATQARKTPHHPCLHCSPWGKVGKTPGGRFLKRGQFLPLSNPAEKGKPQASECAQLITANGLFSLNLFPYPELSARAGKEQPALDYVQSSSLPRMTMAVAALLGQVLGLAAAPGLPMGTS